MSALSRRNSPIVKMRIAMAIVVAHSEFPALIEVRESLDAVSRFDGNDLLTVALVSCDEGDQNFGLEKGRGRHGIKIAIHDDEVGLKPGR